MENLTLVSSSPKIFLSSSSSSSSSPNLNGSMISIRGSTTFAAVQLSRRRCGSKKTRLVVSAHAHQGTGDRVHLPQRVSTNGTEAFASISSSSGKETFSVGVSPQLSAPPPPSMIGSPLLWIGVGVGFSALFSWVATRLKNYAMQQAMKTMMGQMSSSNSQGSAPFSPGSFSSGSPFPFPMPPPSTSRTPSSAGSQPGTTVDVSATKVETAPVSDVKDNTELKRETKKYAFVDVSPEEVSQKDTSESSKESVNAGPTSSNQNGAFTEQSKDAFNGTSQSSGEPSSPLSVEALEKMMEDPTVQKMVYPYLPEEMRNPTTFKWMLQNPQYRQQLEDMLKSMGGSGEWDNRMMDSLKNFDLSSPEVKQQFDQIGLTPEEVISKIMANPEIAMAFQNPRVQAAIMDCSQNPLSITKYQNDKEVMDVFNKISELFPGAAGPL